MPRPGPRPYECVRRAWHSDRHQPIRGSLIQEIFRIVNEIHSSATKKNKEWQEMLPIVVLKAEEILYSKASSEAEYMNFNTLRERLVDAINTIIRLDESTETGEFLQPCIEAALNLGCTPRRASRSERNNNSMSYLSSRIQESPSLSPPMAEKTSQGVVTNSRYIPYFWSLGKPVTIEPTHSGSRFQSLVASNNSTTEKFPATLSPHTVMEIGLAPPSKFSIYPLYYGTDDIQCRGQQSVFEIAPKPISRSLENTNAYVAVAANGITQGQHSGFEITPKPISRSVENTNACDAMAANGITQNDASYSLENLCDNKCDLALRLGPLSTSSPSNENKTSPFVFKDVGSGSFLEETKSNDCSPQMERKLPSFPMVNAYGISGYNSREWNFEGKHVEAEARMGKRKADFSHSLSERHLHWLPKLPFGRFIG